MSARPLIESAVAGLTGSPPFVALFEDGVRRVHGALLSGDDSRLRLDLRDMGVLVQSALVHLPISGVDRIRADVGLRLTAVNSVTETTAEIAHRLRVLSFVLIVAALATAAAAIALARDWRRAVQLLGFSVAGLALAAVLLLAGGRVAVERLSSDEEVDRRAAGAVWDAFLGDLGSLLLLVAAFATVVAAAVASQSTLPDLVPALRRGWELASRKPRRTVWRVARGAALVVLGVAIVVDPLRALRLVGIGGGLVVLYVGVDELLSAARERRAASEEIGRRDLVASFAPVAVGLVAFAAVGAVRGDGRSDCPGRDPHRGLQRPRGAVLQAPERGHAARVAQLDVVVRRGGLVLRRPHAVDRRPAARRRARAADRRALRAAGRRRGAHGPVGAVRAGGQQGSRAVPADARPGGLRGDPAHPRPRPARRGQAGRVPLPPLLRARRHRAHGRPARRPGVPRRASGRGADHRDRGLRAAERDRRRLRGVRARREGLPRPARGPVPDAARDDRQRPAGRGLRREPRRRARPGTRRATTARCRRRRSPSSARRSSRHRRTGRRPASPTAGRTTPRCS